jgi:predicted O-linked N-acetylglucosamine transferase (SPINDLY family)
MGGLKNVFVCPMTLFKVHPDMDFLILNLLSKNPGSSVLFFMFGDTDLHKTLIQRICQKDKSLASRIFIREWADRRSEFMSTLYHARAILDTPYFGAGNTAYLGMAARTPIITLQKPGKRYLSNSSTAALYKQAGYTRWIAESEDQYVNLASEALTTEKTPDLSALFNRTDGTGAFCDWLKDLRIPKF